MVSPHLLKLRLRRFWRRHLAKSVRFVATMGQMMEANGISRLSRLRAVWRFVTIWIVVCLILLGGLLAQINALKGYYQVYEPVPGGRFIEGITGSFTTANPLFAVSDVDTSVSRLLFAGLLRYDDNNQLSGDLAESWSADPSGKVYTVRLRPGLTWHDGMRVTADDVVFTYHMIQNPDVNSPLLASWQGVQVAAVDARVVTFTLPNPLSSFPYSLTNGIVPMHILQAVAPVDLRSTSFNTAGPIGSGPFRWSTIGVSGIADTAETQIGLVPFTQYWAGAPKLTNFTIHAYADQKVLIRAYKDRQLNAVAGLEALPRELQASDIGHVYNLGLTAGVYAFFKTSTGVLANVKVRHALVLAANRAAIIQSIGYSAQVVDEPVLTGQLSYDPAYRQADADRAQATALLDADGWAIGSNGLRSKDGQSLSFNFYTTTNPEYRQVAQLLVKQWRLIGVDARLQPGSSEFRQGILLQHSYDAVLYGISIGADPDVFAYWDSSQNDVRSASRLNLSEYHSTAADLSIEAGRTRLDPALRSVKYRPFLQAWQQDAPALGLYQPRFLYLSHDVIYGLSEKAPYNIDADRFHDVHQWMINRGWVTRP